MIENAAVNDGRLLRASGPSAVPERRGGKEAEGGKGGQSVDGRGCFMRRPLRKTERQKHKSFV